MTIRSAAALLCSLFASSIALAEEVAISTLPPPTPVLSSELLDSKGLTRFHLTSRVTFAEGDRAFSSGFAWAYEARAQIRIIEGLAVSAVVPFGIHKIDDTTSGLFGNLAVGIGGGGALISGPLSLRLGGGLDGSFPTASSGDAEGSAFLAAVRAYEPHLFIPKLGAIRGRGSLDIEVSGFRAGVELALIPAFTSGDPSRFLLLVGGAFRASYEVTSSVEPFVELGGATQVAGSGEVAPPFLITPGVRFHVAELFDPAIFASFNFVAGTAVIFGVDLAIAVRPGQKKKERKRDILDSRDDFI